MNQFEWVGERLVSDRGQPWIGAFERLFPGGEKPIKRAQAGMRDRLLVVRSDSSSGPPSKSLV